MNPVLLKPTGERAAHVVVMGHPAGERGGGPLPGDEAERWSTWWTRALASPPRPLRRRRLRGGREPGRDQPARATTWSTSAWPGAAGIPGHRRRRHRARRRLRPPLRDRGASSPPSSPRSCGGFVVNRFRGDRGPARGRHRGARGPLRHPDLRSPAPSRPARARCRGFARRWTRASGAPPPGVAGIDVAAIRLPRLSNFTDLDPLVVEPGVHVRWVDQPGALGDPDLVVLGGITGHDGRSSVAARQRPRRARRTALRAAPVPPAFLGICGGFQMLGTSIEDPDGVESATATTAGLGWLPVHTVFGTEKITRLASATGPGGHPAARL